MPKSADAFRTISEVADWLGVRTHVLRFWESQFAPVKPVKRAGGRRYYRPSDMALLGGIKKLLHEDGHSIKTVQQMLKLKGVAHVSSFSADLDDLDVEIPTIVEMPAADHKPPTDQGLVETQATQEPQPEAVAPLVSGPENSPAPMDQPVMDQEAAPELYEEAASTQDTVTSAPAEPEAPNVAQSQDTDSLQDEPAILDPLPAEASVEETTEAQPQSSYEAPPLVLGALSKLRNLTAQQAQSIAPLVAQLQELHPHSNHFEKE